MCNKNFTDLGVEVFLVQKCFIYQGSSQEVKKGGPDMLVMSQALAEKLWKDLWSTLKALGWSEELGGAGFARLQTYYMPPGVHRGAGNKVRVHYFDSMQQVRRHVRLQASSAQ